MSRSGRIPSAVRAAFKSVREELVDAGPARAASPDPEWASLSADARIAFLAAEPAPETVQPRRICDRERIPALRAALASLEDDLGLARTWKNLADEPVESIAALLRLAVRVAATFDTDRKGTEDRLDRLNGDLIAAAENLMTQLAGITRVANDDGFSLPPIWRETFDTLGRLAVRAESYPDLPGTPSRRESPGHKSKVIAHWRREIELYDRALDATPGYRRDPDLPELGHADVARLLGALFTGATFTEGDIAKAPPVEYPPRIGPLVVHRK